MFRFDNKFIHAFELDNGPSHIPRITLGVMGSLVLPTPVKSPKLLVYSKDMATRLGLKPNLIEAEEFTLAMAGNQLLDGSEPYSTRYGGHQFGQWADQLGDGRAISLGEVLGADNSSFEIQIKGAGLTPYSRRGDGRAVLRSSIREYICSEAMHFFGVPTTRALSCIVTGDLVQRDMFYDGNPSDEAGAITARVSPTFVRFGHFEILAANEEYKLLGKLVKFVGESYFNNTRIESADDLAAWFKEICIRTCDLVLHWQRVGFVHGVLNTDNMSIVGLTIDYGPFGFLDDYNTEWTPNTTDAAKKRYRYSNQPEVVYWNLQRLAEALSFTELDGDAITPEKQKNLIALMNEGLKAFAVRFEDKFPKMMGLKLGLTDFNVEHDMPLLVELDQCLSVRETDFTIFYRMLSKNIETISKVIDREFTDDQINGFLAGAIYLFSEPKEDSYPNENPGAKKLEAEILSPENLQKWRMWFQNYARRLYRADGGDLSKTKARAAVMNKTNPFIIPRNYILQEVIDEITDELNNSANDKLDSSKLIKLNSLMKALENPFEENELTKKYFAKRPEWARSRAGCSALSCSS